MKVDLVTIVRFQKSIVIMKPDYLPDRLSFVGFHHSLKTAHLIPQLPPCAFESVIECEINIGVTFVQLRGAIDVDVLSVGQDQMQAYLVKPSAVVTPRRF